MERKIAHVLVTILERRRERLLGLQMQAPCLCTGFSDLTILSHACKDLLVHPACNLLSVIHKLKTIGKNHLLEMQSIRSDFEVKNVSGCASGQMSALIFVSALYNWQSQIEV